MRNQGCVEARDLTEYKVDLIRENVQRAGVSCVVPKVKDAEQLDAEWIGKADVVIADLPCTGYGVIGRKPVLVLATGNFGKVKELRAMLGGTEVLAADPLFDIIAEEARVGRTIAFPHEACSGRMYRSGIVNILERAPFDALVGNLLDTAK